MGDTEHELCMLRSLPTLGTLELCCGYVAGFSDVEV